MKNVVLSTIFFCVAISRAFGQNCQGYEQSAFNYFCHVLINENDYLKNKKFIFSDTINDQYSKFEWLNILRSSDSNKEYQLENHSWIVYTKQHIMPGNINLILVIAIKLKRKKCR